MDRRGHAMPGMDRVYNHVTPEMREHLCAALEDLWQTAIKERRALSPRSNVALLDRLLIEREGQKAEDLAPQSAPTDPDGHLQERQNPSLTCGAPLRNRTVDLLLTMETLCRLS